MEMVCISSVCFPAQFIIWECICEQDIISFFDICYFFYHLIHNLRLKSMLNQLNNESLLNAYAKPLKRNRL